jgi:SNF2 family DNA or RNA helicase
MAWAAIDPDPQLGPWLAVGCAKSENHLCEQVPGMNFRKSDGIWRAPLSWPSWVALLTVWQSQPLEIARGLQEWADHAWEKVQGNYRLRAALDAPPGTTPWLERLDADTGRTLFPFQRGGVQWLVLMERCLLEDPQGNGKTPQLIRGIQMARAADGDMRPWLVIAPAAALYNWKRELAIWAPELSVRVIEGSAAKRRKQIMDEGEADVYVIGWKTVRLHTRLAVYPGKAFVRCDEHGGSTGKTVAQCEVHDKELNAIDFAGVIPDEAHRMKDAGSKQTRAVWWLGHQSRYFWPATGTPVGDTIEDIWSVMHGIDPRGFPGKSKYLTLYAVSGHSWTKGREYLGIRPENARAFHASIQPYIRRIPKEVARAQLPDAYQGRLPFVYRYPEMLPAQDRIYKQLRKQALAELDSTTITPANKGVAFSRMCQVAAAMIETEDGEDSQGFHKQLVKMIAPSSKADDLIEFLDDNPGSLVVCMNSPQLLKICESRLAAEKITHCAIRADMSPAERDRSVQWFQSGECRVILMTGRTGGEAITLTASDTVLFLQPDPSFFVNEQVIGRIDRIGQQNAVRVVYSITPGTVEERLHQLSLDKTARAESVTLDADLLRWLITGEEQPAGV